MKNKIFYFSFILLTALALSSCAARYGCPNHSGAMKIQPKQNQANV